MDTSMDWAWQFSHSRRGEFEEDGDTIVIAVVIFVMLHPVHHVPHLLLINVADLRPALGHVEYDRDGDLEVEDHHHHLLGGGFHRRLLEESES